MKPTYDVLVVGGYCMDFIFTGMPGMPILGQEIVARDFNVSLGGSANAAVAMHRLGLKVAWMGDFGSDTFSEIALAQIKKEGLDTTFCHFSRKTHKSVTVALSFPDDRAFIAYYDREPFLPAYLLKVIGIDTRVIYINHFFSSAALGLKNLVNKNAKIIMDSNSPENINIHNPKISRTIKRLSLFTLNRSELFRLTGKKEVMSGIRILGNYCPCSVVKDGSGGAYAMEKGMIYHVPAIKVNPIDTTGAGDCFNAGFIKAMLDGKPIEECLLWVNIVGARSTEGRGALDRVTRENDVRHWIKRNVKRSVKWI
jgi:sugar/nucleoside kinase (ribokinase family)